MRNVPGIKIIKDTKGQPKTLVIDLKKRGEDLEDYVDGLIAESRKKEVRFSWESVKKELQKPLKSKPLGKIDAKKPGKKA